MAGTDWTLVLLYVAIRLLARLWKAPRRIGRAAGRYRDKTARDRLTRGLIAIAEGDTARGERMLARSAGRSDAPALNYLTAARAAQQLGAEDRRDNWLKLAVERDPKAGPAVLITQAELQMDRARYEDALVTLQRLESQSPGQPRGVALGGAILTETIFAWPGVGKWMYDAVMQRDYMVIQGGTLFIATIFVVINLCVDVLYAVINPRISVK